MLNLWKQASKNSETTKTLTNNTENTGALTLVESGRPTKKRKTESLVPLPLPNDLPRPVMAAEDVFNELEKSNIITVVENSKEKTKLLRTVLGQSIVLEQSRAASGAHSRRVVLFVVDDNQSLAQYATELEEVDFSVGSYTVTMHTSGTNQWPSIIYNDVVVVAANMLLDSLTDGNFKLSQAHLLVVSDAQRVVPMVTSHPVLRLMSDIYSKTPDPPKVFALLMSSPDRWASLDLTRLETPLRARSFFLATQSVDSWLGPMELVIEYESPSDMSEPILFAEVLRADPEGTLVRPHHYRRARRVFLQLGSLGSEIWWHHTLGNLTASSASSEVEIANVRAKLGALRNPVIPQSLDFYRDARTSNATPKLGMLIQVLQCCAHHGERFRGLILVQDRAVAETLVEVLQIATSEVQFVRPRIYPRTDASKYDTHDETLRAFANGECNLLVLTKSYEDVDIPKATTIIYFDQFDDQLSYAFSHVHSRGRLAHLLHMVERSNNEHRRILCRLQTVDGELRAWIAGLVRGDSDAPPKSIHIGLDPYRSDSEDEEKDSDYIFDATTSARLYRWDAVAALYRFAIEVQATSNTDDSEKVKLAVETEGRSSEEAEIVFRYMLTFPKHTALPDISGPQCHTMWQARREACYQVCQELTRVGLMHHRHFPQALGLSEDQRDRSASIRGEPVSTPDIKTANTSAKTHGYPRKFPDFWNNSQQSPPTTLYPTVVAPDNMGGEVYAPILLLTRAPLPPTSEFSLFFSGLRTVAHFFKAIPIEVTEAQLKALHGYTLRVTKSLTNKPLDCPLGSLLCYFAPLDSTWHSSLSPRWPLLSVTDHIPWGSIQLAADYFAIPLLDGTTPIDERARDAIVLDRQVEFTMRHFVVKVRHDLTPLSKAEDSPREAEYPNFLEYCKARCKDFGGLEDENQPMIEVSAVPGVINNLHPTSAPPTPPAKAPLKYLVPELCYKFTIPASTYRTLWLMPSVMNKIDSFLLVKELNAKLFHNAILEQQLLIALSTPAAWTEHNYERLEFLGDSFLKVVASNFCYATMPTSEVGHLHNTRQTIISNKVLQEGATCVGVPSYIQHKRFVAKLWQPPHSTPNVPENVKADDADGDVEMAENMPEKKDKGKRSKKQRQMDEQNTLWMGDKIIADVVEAILAASFLSGGHEVALQAAKRLQVPIPVVAQWSDYARIASQHTAQAHASPAVAALPRSTIDSLERIFGSTFSKPELLAQALTHTSVFAGSEGTSYDRLEFIGDAILDFLVSRYIWERHPYLSPGGLTMLKAAMVSNQTLAAFCVHAGLQQYLRMESKELSTSIQKYIDFLRELQKKEYDFATREQRLPGQYWLDLPMEPPKCLSDVVESLIGALYVSDNFFEVGVGRFFEGVFKPFLEAHVRLQTLSTNPKVTLLELLQAEGCQDNAVVKQPAARQNMPVHMDVVIHGKVIASATDPSAAIATRKVSLAALDTLANDPELLARTCDCKSAVSTKAASPKKSAAKSTAAAEDEEAEAAEVEAAMEADDDAE